MMRFTFAARLVFPVDQPPLWNGCLEMENGRVTAVYQRPSPSVAGIKNAIDMGNVALVPGLINAHTHWEFSDLRQPLQPATPFTGWLKSLMQSRRNATTDKATRIQLGATESMAAGCAVVGEIATAGNPVLGTTDWRAPVTSGRTVAFHESIGLRPERREAQLQAARNWLSTPLAEGIIRGLSPHAPYTVHPALLSDLVDLAKARNAPVAMHLAETTAELELLQHGTGEFVEFLDHMGAWDPQAIPRGSRPLDCLRSLEPLSHVLAVHGNYLNAEEQAFVAARPQFTVVYCPRTHAFFGHAPHPWQELLAQGCRVALGTDSRASNPDLSLWNEVVWLRKRFPTVDPALLLKLATQNGAEALGLAAEFGSLVLGKSANVAVVMLPDVRSTDPWELLYAGRMKT